MNRKCLSLVLVAVSTVCQSNAQVCGGNSTARKGVIMSPSYPDLYENNLDCEYIILQPSGYQITITFTDFSLEPQDFCSYDFVEIHDGATSSFPLIGKRYCNNTIPPVLRTTQNVMLIHFHTDISNGYRGFSAFYDAACGGNFTALKGVFTSPFYPDNYTNNLDCIYVIRAPAGYRVTLSFHDFRLEAGDSCEYDFVEIHDGEFLTSSVIGNLWCSVSLPLDRRTIGDTMLIRFKTNNFVTDRGFSASYIAEIIPQEFLLVTISGGYIDRVEMNTLSIVNVPVIGLNYPTGINYDPVDDRMYWTDIHLKEMRSAFLNGSDNRLVRGPVNTTGTLDGITLDTQSRLIFYTDAGNQVIGLITISTYQHKYVITDNLDKPRAIVLDILYGVVFWTDWGTRPKIERANYDGSDRKVIVSISIDYPNGLALDATRNRLYWVDSRTQTVEWTDTEGLNRAKIYSFPNAMLVNLVLHNNQLYITDWTSAGSNTNVSYVYRMNTDGTDVTKVLYVKNNRFSGIYVYSAIFDRTGTNGCTSGKGGCSHICIPSSGNNTKCLCPSGQYLSDDQRTCLLQAPVSTSVSFNTRDTSVNTSFPISTFSTVATSPKQLGPVAIKGNTLFITDGTHELTLTCDPSDVSFIEEITWNVPCVRKQNISCTFKPHPPEDDGTRVTCTVKDIFNQSAMAACSLELRYPPFSQPEINGYSSGEILQVGSSLTLTCTVKGGKPLVDSVLFSCPGYSDTPDIKSPTEVMSILTLNPIKANDDGITCVCIGIWKEERLYKLSDTRTLEVNGTDSVPMASSNYLLIGGGAGGGLVLILVIIVIIVCVIKRRGTPSYDRPRSQRQKNKEMEGPYTIFDKEVQNEESNKISNIYSEIGHSHEESINIANMGKTLKCNLLETIL